RAGSLHFGGGAFHSSYDLVSVRRTERVVLGGFHAGITIFASPGTCKASSVCNRHQPGPPHSRALLGPGTRAGPRPSDWPRCRQLAFAVEKSGLSICRTAS